MHYLESGYTLLQKINTTFRGQQKQNLCFNHECHHKDSKSKVYSKQGYPNANKKYYIL